MEQIIINHTRRYVYWLGSWGFKDIQSAVQAIDIESGLFTVYLNDKLELHDTDNLNASYTRKLFNKGFICNRELPLFFYMEPDSEDD